jgi:thymidylate synthase (FAD)
MEQILMDVKLVSITKPLVEGINTAEEFIVYTARVSNPSNQMNTETSAKLINYLIKHRHWSPFQMVTVGMEINTTRDIGRQILRHNSYAFQEFSQRYAEPGELGFVTREARLQDTKNRQLSVETNNNELQYTWEQYQNAIIMQAKQAYEWAIRNGIAKEQARVVLPEGLTKSRMYISGTLRSWIHYCTVRCSKDVQKEHRNIARAAALILMKEFPSLEEYLLATYE